MMQRSSIKKLAAAGLAGALTLAVATPSVAGGGRTAAAVAGGFAAGALIGAAAASANAGYYGPGYAYEPGYVYDPGYAEYPGYGAYARAPGPAYAYPYRYGDVQVGATGSGSPVYRSQLGPYCTLGLKEQDRC
jgi:hypothetical protein